MEKERKKRKVQRPIPLKTIELENGKKVREDKIKGMRGNLNRNGRKKGVKNIITSEIREMIEDFLSDNKDKFQLKFDGISDPEKACRIYIEAAKLIIPKPKDEGEHDDEERRHKELLDRIWPVPRQD